MLSASLMLGSCSKNEEVTDSTPKTTECKIASIKTKSLTSDGMRDSSVWQTESYSYDDKGRLSKIHTVSTEFIADHLYEYQADKIIVDGKEKFSLDAQGRISGMIEPYTGNPITFTYNAEGYLSEMNMPKSGNTASFTYTDGNLTKVVKGSTTFNISYTNEPLKNDLLYGYIFKNVFSMYDFSPSLVSQFLGKASKNSISKIEVSPKSQFISDVEFTYNKDADGNVTSFKAGNMGYDLTYNCQ